MVPSSGSDGMARMETVLGNIDIRVSCIAIRFVFVLYSNLFPATIIEAGLGTGPPRSIARVHDARTNRDTLNMATSALFAVGVLRRAPVGLDRAS